MPGPAEAFSVVVLGAMNPRLHHPWWYQYVKALTTEEVQLALAGPALAEFIVSPGASQFRVGNFVTACTLDRWEVRSPVEADAPRLVEIAAQVYRALDHTPVNAFGFNFDYQVPLDMHPVSNVVARQLHQPFGAPVDVIGSSYSWSQRSTHERWILTRSTFVIADASTVIVRNNHHYQLLPQDQSAVAHFDFGDYINAAFPDARTASRAQVDQTTAALQRLNAN